MRRIFLVLFILTFSRIGFADPITIEGSQSANGKYFLTIEPQDYEGGSSGTAQIRLLRNRKIVGTFKWSGFGVRPNSTAFQVLWNPNCDAFAISYEITRGYMDYDVYALHNKRWVKVKAPDFLEVILKQQCLAEAGDKGFQTPLEWEKDDVLKFNVGGRAYVRKDDPSSMIYFHAEVWLHLKDYDSRPILSLVRVKELPREGG